MFGKRRPTQPSPVGPSGEQNPAPSAEEALVRALNDYRREFAQKLTPEPDESIEQARKLVAHAREIIGQSGLGPALAPTLIEAVMSWHAWAKRDDFEKYKGFPASDVTAEKTKNARGQTVIATAFTYGAARYIVKFTDEGYSSAPDGEHHGAAELITDERTVLGLNLTQEVTSDSNVWRWSNVFAFTPGNWMKDLIEISTIISR